MREINTNLMIDELWEQIERLPEDYYNNIPPRYPFFITLTINLDDEPVFKKEDIDKCIVPEPKFKVGDKVKIKEKYRDLWVGGHSLDNTKLIITQIDGDFYKLNNEDGFFPEYSLELIKEPKKLVAPDFIVKGDFGDTIYILDKHGNSILTSRDKQITIGIDSEEVHKDITIKLGYRKTCFNELNIGDVFAFPANVKSDCKNHTSTFNIKYNRWDYIYGNLCDYDENWINHSQINERDRKFMTVYKVVPLKFADVMESE